MLCRVDGKFVGGVVHCRKIKSIKQIFIYEEEKMNILFYTETLHQSVLSVLLIQLHEIHFVSSNTMNSNFITAHAENVLEYIAYFLCSVHLVKWHPCLLFRQFVHSFHTQTRIKDSFFLLNIFFAGVCEQPKTAVWLWAFQWMFDGIIKLMQMM